MNINKQSTLTNAGRGFLDRRNFLAQSSTGLGAIALTQLLAEQNLLGDDKKKKHIPKIDHRNPHAARKPLQTAKAKNVLVLFMAGACSQLETWDYKPELIKRNDTPLEGGPSVTFQGPAGNLAKPQYKFKPHGETGKNGFRR